MSYYYNNETNEYKVSKIVAHTLLGVVIFIALLMAILPIYNVWSKQQRGRAALSEAEFSKQVKLEEAKSNLEAEKLNALAEIERAKGAAESIKIEGGQLTENYIKYLWIRNLETGDKQLIYVPTEAGLPVLEAGKRP